MRLEVEIGCGTADAKTILRIWEVEQRRVS
jgi:hypothetical protein